jgi:hypothetical protein
VPPAGSLATGTAYAVLNKNTLLLRWKLSYTGLSGPATAGNFHGPAVIGANANSTLALKATIKSPLEGQAKLTPALANFRRASGTCLSELQLTHVRKFVDK